MILYLLESENGLLNRSIDLIRNDVLLYPSFHYDRPLYGRIKRIESMPLEEIDWVYEGNNMYKKLKVELI